MRERQPPDVPSDIPHADEALRESEARFRAMFEQASVGIVEVTLDGRMHLPNPGFCAIIGYTEDEARHLRVRDVTHAKDYEAEAELTRRLLAGELPSFTIEKRYVRKDGQLVWGQMTTTLVRHPSGEPRSALAVVEDITDRKRADEALRQSEERFRLMADAVPQIVWITDPEGRTEFFNRQWTAYTGKAYEPSTAAEVAATDVHPEDAAATMEAFDEARRTGSTFLVEHRIRSKDGDYRWFLVRGEPYRDPRTGEIIRWFGASVDIHDRKLAEAALREREARYRTLVQNLPDYAIFHLDPDGIITESTAGAEHVTGYTAAEVLGQHVSLYYTPEDVAAGEVVRELGEAAETGRAEREGWRIRKGGERFWVNEIATGIYDAYGRLTGFTKISRDRTERQRAEEALRASEERHRLIVESARDYAIFTLDEQGRIASWSPGAEAVFGWTAAEALGQPVVITFTHEDRLSGVPEAELTTARVEVVAPDVRWHLRKDGGRVFIEGTNRALRDASGRVRGFLKIGQDVTQRRQLEAEGERLLVAEAVATERQAILKRVVVAQEEERRRVAHEVHDSITQLASAAALRLDDLAERLPPTLLPEDREDLERARDLARRAAQEARRLIAGLRPEALDDFGLAGAVAHEVEALRMDGWQVSLKDGELVGVRLPAELEITLYRVAQEALANVRKHTEPTRVAVELQRQKGAVRLRVRDWGPGFEPPAARTGAAAGERLGLVGMRERLALLGGRLDVRSHRGGGTTITASLPLPEER